MSKVKVLSRTMFFSLMKKGNLNENNIEEMEKEGLYIISINDLPGDNMQPDFVSKNKSNVLTMQFGDFRIPLNEKDEKHVRSKGHAIFNDVMANDIRIFLKKIKEKHHDDFTLIVHCHAGVSRSAAIGRYAFEELLNGTFAEFEFQNPYTAYNPIVYQKLKELPI